MSIRARLLLLASLATLVPAILVGLRFMQDREAKIEAARRVLAVAAGTLVTDLDERIQGAAQLLYGLARARDLEEPDRIACSAFLGAVRQQYPQYTTIATIGADGRIFCDSLNTGRDFDLSDRDYFRQAMAMTGDGVAMQPGFGRATGISTLNVAYPVRADASGLRYILIAALNLQNFAEDHADLRALGLDIVMTDRAGTVLVWHPGDRAGTVRVGETAAGTELMRFAAAVGSGRTAEIPDPGGTTRIWATDSSALTRTAGLRIMIAQSRGALVAEANQRLMQDLAVLALVSAMLFGGVWVLAELGIRRDVKRIIRLVASIAAGDFGARIPGTLPGGELGELMAELNRAAESLQEQRTAIETLNRRLSQSQKMEAVGQLTGGMAHDFNNLLTVILGTAELLSERLAHDPALLQLAEMTTAAAERGAELTRSLLAFARRQPLDPKPTDVSAEIRRMELLVRRTIGGHIASRFILPEDVDPALVDPAQLESAVLNLVLNSRDAMRDGGLLTVEIANAVLDRDYAGRHEEVTPGAYVCIAVTDTGSGMTPDVMAQVFEPFFTTKEFGQGSGLGLSMVYGFAKQSAGHVKIYSEVGHGTTVKLYLPRATVKEPQRDWFARAPRPTGGTENVLVVEDNDMVRAHVIGELTYLGYHVLAARDGPTAMDILRGPQEIDLLFTDVVMPGGLSGPALAEQARLLRPRIRVLYTSGYTENAVVHHGRLDPGVVLLSKPYRRQELAEKLRLVLRAEPAAS